MSIVKLARPEIASLHPYEAAAQIDDTIRLNANEAPRSTDDSGFRRPLNRYPEVRPTKLQKALAARFGCRSEQLLVTRGSSEAIDLVIRSFCRAGQDSVLVTKPSFSMYWHYAAVQGARVIEVPTLAERNFAIDIDDILAACDDSTRVIFVCSPNNPTGTTLPHAELERLLDARGDRSAIVVDEAYVEFGSSDSVTSLLDRFDNLLVLRTLSKALGFAGARCGAVAGPAEVIRILNAVQAPYALATPVIECVEDALQSEKLEDARALVAQTVTERTRVSDALEAFSFVQQVWPSDANFLLVRTSATEEIMMYCKSRKILLRHFGGDLADCIRITIGSPAENDALLHALEAFADAKNG